MYWTAGVQCGQCWEKEKARKPSKVDEYYTSIIDSMVVFPTVSVPLYWRITWEHNVFKIRQFIIFMFVPPMYRNKTTIIKVYLNNRSTSTLSLTMQLQYTVNTWTSTVHTISHCYKFRKVDIPVVCCLYHASAGFGSRT